MDADGGILWLSLLSNQQRTFDTLVPQRHSLPRPSKPLGGHNEGTDGQPGGGVSDFIIFCATTLHFSATAVI